MVKNWSVSAGFFLLLLGLTSCPTPTLEDLKYGQGGAGAYALAEKQYTLFFDPLNLHQLEVKISRTAWDDLNQDMRDYQTQFGSMKTGGYYPVDFTYEGINGQVVMPGTGFRTRGNTSRALPEPSTGVFTRAHFHLKFNETFDLAPGSEAFKDRNGRKLFGQRSLMIKYSNDLQGALRELYAYNFLNEMGLKAPKATIAHLVIKIQEPGNVETELDYGLYTVIETVNKSFLTRHWGGDKEGNLYKALWQQGGPAVLDSLVGVSNGSSVLGAEDWVTNYRPSYDLQSGSDEDSPDHSVLVDFTRALNEKSGSALKSWLDKNFEIQDFLKWMAANLLLGNPDDYRAMGNNYHLYFPELSKISFIPYDYDHSLGQGWHPFNTETVGIFEVPDLCGQLLGSPQNRVLTDKILDIPQYKAAYVSYLNQMIQGPFSHANFLNLYNQIRDLTNGIDLYGPDGGVTVLSSDPGVESYFSSRILKTQQDINAFNSGSTLELTLVRKTGFTDWGGGSYGILMTSGSSLTNITVEADLEGALPAKVRFDLQPGWYSWEAVPPTVSITDATEPFEAVFNVAGIPSTPGEYRLQLVALDESDSELFTSEVYILGRAYYEDYVSVQNNGNGTYTFRFQPSHEAFVDRYGSLGSNSVYLRGAFPENDSNWAEALEMTDVGAGVYEVTVLANAGNQYKFFYDLDNTYHPLDDPWDGMWFEDFLNPKNSGSPDYNSLVP